MRHGHDDPKRSPDKNAIKLKFSLASDISSCLPRLRRLNHEQQVHLFLSTISSKRLYWRLFLAMPGLRSSSTVSQKVIPNYSAYKPSARDNRYKQFISRPTRLPKGRKQIVQLSQLLIITQMFRQLAKRKTVPLASMYNIWR